MGMMNKHGPMMMFQMTEYRGMTAIVLFRYVFMGMD